MSSNKPLIIFSIILAVSLLPWALFSFGALFADSGVTSGLVAAIYTLWWYPAFAVLALIIAWTSRSVVGGIICLVAGLIAANIFFNIRESKRESKRIQEAVATQQAKVAKASRDFVCDDGSFISVDKPTGYRQFTFFDKNGIDTFLGSFSFSNPNAYSFRDDITTVQAAYIKTCKNTEGKTFADTYQEEFLSSTYKPKAFPVSKEDAVELVKHASVVVKLAESFQKDDSSVKVTYTVSDSERVWPPTGETYWAVFLNTSDSSQGPHSSQTYKVFSNTGKIQ